MTAGRPQKRKILLVIAGVVVVNVVLAGVYLAADRKARREAEAAARGNMSHQQELVRAARAQGLAELENGKYAAAAAAFMRAIEVGGVNPEVQELARIAVELRDREAANGAAPTEAAVPVAVVAPEPAAEASPEPSEPDSEPQGRDRGRAPKAKPAPPARTRSETDARGTVLVNSTPSGLTVSFDGRAQGNTPLRIAAEPGRHTVELYKGRTQLYTKSVNVAAARVVVLDVEVPNADAAEKPPAAVPQPDPPKPTLAATTNEPAAPTPAPAPPPPPDPAPRAASEQPAALKPGSIVVLANASVSGTRMSTAELRAIYTGESTTLNGSTVVPAMRPMGSSASAAVLARIGFQQRQFKEHWGKVLYYAGRNPPKTIAASSDIVRFVASTPGAICPILASELEELPPNTLKRIIVGP